MSAPSSPPLTHGPPSGGALGVTSEGSTPPAQGALRRSWLGLACLLLVTLVIWGPASIPEAPGPSFDDREAVIGNPVVEGSLPAVAAFERDYWHHLEDAGHFRPLASLLLRWDQSRSGPPAGERSGAAPASRSGAEPDWGAFRETNVVLHALVILLLGAALIRLDRAHGLPIPWIGLGLLALHPACADVVAWVSGRTSLVSALGAGLGLLGATFLARTSRAPGLGGAVLAFTACSVALLGKEDGVVLVPVLALVAARCAGGRGGLGALAGGLIALAAVAALRQQALGSPLPSSPSAPLASLPLLERVPIGLAAWWRGLMEFLTPWAAWPPSAHLADLESSPGAGPRALALIAVFLVAFMALARQTVRQTGRQRARAAAGLASLGAVLIAIAPLVQLVPAGELFAPRFLYQPMLLGCYGVAALADTALAPLRSRRLRIAVQVGILAVCAAAAPRAAATYEGRASFWSAHLPDHSEDPRVWNDLGNAAREAGELAEARAAFERAVQLDPDYSRPRTNLGTLALAEGDLLEAELQLRAAVAAGPRNPVARANLGNVLLRAEAFEEAAEEYRRATALAPGRAAYHRGLGRALRLAGDAVAARAALQQALALDPGDERARAELGRLGTER